MQTKLVQFERNQVWELISKHANANVICTKLIFKNKYVHGTVSRNKARLMA